MQGLKVKEFIDREGERLGIRTQEELSRVLGVSDQTVSNWVKGKARAELSEEMFERKSDFFLNRLFAKIDKMDIK